jgi:hypothetical protein
MKNPYEGKTLEQLKADRDKSKKLLPFFAGIMLVAMIAIIYSAYVEKSWGKLGTCAVFLTLLPIYSSIKSIEAEIKRREELKN